MVNTAPHRPGRGTGKPETELDPKAVLASLALEQGRWGELALDGQWEDAEAIFSAEGPRRHFLLRGRGMSKSTDVAAIALTLLITEAPQQARIYCYAVDQGQAALMIEAIAGIVDRSGWGRWVNVGASTVLSKPTGASLVVASSDGASAFGTRPWLTIVDEVGAWPNSTNHRRLWSAIVSAVPKVPGSRLVVISTAGSPTGLGAEIWKQAESSPSYWRTSKRPGPSPWWTEDDVASLQASLTDAEWRRLILCDWAEGDDALTTVEDIAACTRAGTTTMPWQRARGPYVAALDIGTRRDLTALAVGHTEHRESGRVVIIDRVLSWRPSKHQRVDLGEVEEAVRRVCKAYRVKHLRFDRMQAEQLTANLARHGVRTKEYVFSLQGTTKLARSLYTALRDRAVELPDDEELISELGSVRMVETGPNTVKMQNPVGTHDDVATAVGMVCADLTEVPDTASGRIFSATGEHYNRAKRDGSPKLPQLTRVRQKAKQAPAGVIWIPQ